MTFQDLGLTGPIVKALTQEGYTEPTPIQQGAIPPALAGRDVLGCAQTGTGKTCAFATPILQRLAAGERGPIRSLILTPTRELAIQIGDSFGAYGRHLSLRHGVVFGGVGQQPQVDAIRRGLDILVATPGRLLDLHGQGLVDLSGVEIFVLDEADRMLDMGFIHDVRRVIRLLPLQKQTLFFSATMPPEVMELVNSLLHDAVRVEVDPVSSPVEVIQQSLYYVDKVNKTRLLAHLLEEMDIEAALVFSRTKYGANRIARDLEKAGISAVAIHGNKSQTARVQALQEFRAGRVRVLVATDIAARGIDIEELSHVFNYNLPDVPETYVHRIGRTGRAGHDGVAISFCQFDEKGELKAIEKLLGRAIPVVEGHPWPMTHLEPPQRERQGHPGRGDDGEARARRTADPAGARRRAREKREDSPAPTKERPRTRGVRQGRLEDTLPAQPAMPSGDFVKPNPLDSERILDATARLLAPRRPLRVPKDETGGTPGKKSQRGNHRKGSAPAGGQKKPAEGAGGRSRRREERPRPLTTPLRSDRQKDSTQQKSLMRPYYLNEDD